MRGSRVRDLFHFTFCVSRKFHNDRRSLFHIRRIFHFTIRLCCIISSINLNLQGDKNGQCYISLWFERSRKNTLAKALAERLNLRFIDIEDIYFSKQDNPDYPYEKSRSYGEVVSLLTNIVNDENDFVLASVAGSFGDEFISHLRCVISIEVPKEIRLKRVYNRSYILFGEKSYKGGDFYEQIKSFHNFCASRDENLVNDWLSTI